MLCCFNQSTVQAIGMCTVVYRFLELFSHSKFSYKYFNLRTFTSASLFQSKDLHQCFAVSIQGPSSSCTDEGGPWIEIQCILQLICEFAKESTTLSGCDVTVNHSIPHGSALGRNTHANLPQTAIL